MFKMNIYLKISPYKNLFKLVLFNKSHDKIKNKKLIKKYILFEKNARSPILTNSINNKGHTYS